MSRPQWPDSINSPSEIAGTIQFAIALILSKESYRSQITLPD